VRNLSLVLRAAALASVAVAASCGGPGPHLEVPTPPPDRYVAVRLDACFALSNTDCWAIGELDVKDGGSEGLILATFDTGRHWKRFAGEHIDLASVKPSTIHFIDRLRGWIGARRITQEGIHRAVVLRTYDGGGHWIEQTLPISDDVKIEDVHSLEFATDFDGVISVMTAVAGDAAAKETIFVTRDGGRSWTVAQFREPSKTPPATRSECLAPASSTNGFRVRRSTRPGVVLCETTASGGLDWMPVAEFSPSYVSSWY
jgi:photosystem II stability/assembly factor-like uncharacterized protein